MFNHTKLKKLPLTDPQAHHHRHSSLSWFWVCPSLSLACFAFEGWHILCDCAGTECRLYSLYAIGQWPLWLGSWFFPWIIMATRPGRTHLSSSGGRGTLMSLCIAMILLKVYYFQFQCLYLHQILLQFFFNLF